MNPKTRKLLFDIRTSCSQILQFTAGKGADDFKEDDLLRSAVERKFEIIGEAVSRIRRVDPATFGRISQAPRIIAFRNRLIHGYDVIDDSAVWRAIQNDVPKLEAEVHQLMEE